MKILIDIPDHLYSVIKNKECTHNNVLTEAVDNGTPIPDNVTNGDAIKAMFPNTSLHIDERSHTVWVGYEEMSFRIDWWNAPYQKGGKE